MHQFGDSLPPLVSNQTPYHLSVISPLSGGLVSNFLSADYLFLTASLYLLVFQAQLSWDCRQAAPCVVYVVLLIEPRVSGMLGKQSVAE